MNLCINNSHFLFISMNSHKISFATNLIQNLITQIKLESIYDKFGIPNIIDTQSQAYYCSKDLNFQYFYSLFTLSSKTKKWGK